jgi:hypothetical protein
MLWFAMGCSGEPAAPAVVSNEPDAAEAIPAVPSSKEGWGAVFWEGEVAYKVGGGLDTVGPRGRSTARLREGHPQFCGGQALDDAAPHAVLAVPDGKIGDAPEKPAVISAATVEAAAWRLDEVLPGRDRFTPVNPDASPALQRGLEVGSVVKVRRFGGPPVLLAGGRRGAVGGLVLLDREATASQGHLLADGFDAIPRVLPPADLDGDGNLETALFTDHRVLLVRLLLTPSSAELVPLESWSCSAPAVP